MTKFALALLSTIALSPASVSAADLAAAPIPTKAPAIARPLSNWTGFYIGGNVGYSWGSYGASDATGTLVNVNGGAASYVFNPVTGNGNGLSAGIQAGYNWQIEQAVLGIEADWQISIQKPPPETRLLRFRLALALISAAAVPSTPIGMRLSVAE